jgi:transposase
MVSTWLGVDTMKVESQGYAKGSVLRRRRDGKRIFSDVFKRAVVEQCLLPGASVAGVALSHGLNANLVRKWIVKQAGALASVRSAARLLPVRVNDALPGSGAEVERSLAFRRARQEVVSGALEVELPAARVRVWGRVEVAALRCVIEALSRRR